MNRVHTAVPHAFDSNPEMVYLGKNCISRDMSRSDAAFLY